MILIFLAGPQTSTHKKVFDYFCGLMDIQNYKINQIFCHEWRPLTAESVLVQGPWTSSAPACRMASTLYFSTLRNQPLNSLLLITKWCPIALLEAGFSAMSPDLFAKNFNPIWTLLSSTILKSWIEEPIYSNIQNTNLMCCFCMKNLPNMVK